MPPYSLHWGLKSCDLRNGLLPETGASKQSVPPLPCPAGCHSWLVKSCLHCKPATSAAAGTSRPMPVASGSWCCGFSRRLSPSPRPRAAGRRTRYTCLPSSAPFACQGCLVRYLAFLWLWPCMLSLPRSCCLVHPFCLVLYVLQLHTHASLQHHAFLQHYATR